MNINSIIFGGRLAADPDIRAVGDTKVASFRLISNRVYFKGKGKDREKCEEVTSMDVKAWGGRANAAEYLKKGDGCVVQGYIKEENWEKDGVKQYKKIIDVQELHFGEKKGSGNSAKSENKKEEAKVEEQVEEQVENQNIDDQEVPF